MKLKITQIKEAIIDTTDERKRIKKVFKDKQDKTTREKLYKLMDLIEKGEWEKALKEVDGKWWSGYDRNVHCPRLEFIGFINDKNYTFGSTASYLDLIWQMNNKNVNMKVVNEE